MYQVLYRKWRPKAFTDVSGQEHITVTLQNEVASKRLNHAYLFTGSRGTGKTTCAKILAKAVNCLNPQNGNPCGECEICRGIDNGSILDVIEMDAASNRNLDDIRRIIDEISFKPAKCKYRVYIIDEVHMLTTQAFNALLKTLEEPPEHVIFILATTEIHKLLPTIISRCQRFDFHRIPPKAIAGRLLYVAAQEQVELSDSAAMLIASVSDGALRDALSLLDRCIAISSQVDDEVVRSAAGLARKTYLFELAAAAINKNTAKSLEIIDRLYAESKDMSRLCEELISHFRSLMLIKSVRNPRDILVMSDDEFEEAQTQADYLSLADIVYYMDVLSKAFQRMGKGTSDRTEFETAMVKLSSAELDGTTEALTARVAALEKAVRRGITVNVQTDGQALNSSGNEIHETSEEESDKPVFEAAQPVPVSKSAPIAKPAPEVQSAPQKSSRSIEEIYRNAQPFPEWIDVVSNMKSASISIASAFSNSAAYVSDNYLLIDTTNEMAFELLRNSSRKEEIRKIIKETTGRSYRLGPYKKPQQEQKTQDPIDILKKGLEGTDVEITEV